jgi:class 3 adenylate cyclase/tetratricopeptide (TPR) repeat protein
LQCPNCQSAVANGQRFCAACGARLPAECPQCHAALSEGASFCTQCGLGVGRAPDASVTPEAGERRQITVLFSDLVNSTALSSRIDPEDLGAVIGVYQEAVAAAVRRFEGHIGQFQGDGVLVYFGYPLAHEDDALRAVNAAVEIRDSLPAMRARIRHFVPDLGEQPIEIRIGVHTGPVVMNRVGDGSRQVSQAFGDTMNLAARLQTRAEPDHIVISDSTRHLVRHAFVTEEIGLEPLKGIPEPVRVWRVHGRAESRPRVDRFVPADLTPLVGRDAEIANLLERWRRVRQGLGQALLVVGEAGVGKSRLVHALHEWIAEDQPRWIDCDGSALHQNSAFHPVVTFLKQLIGLRREQSRDEQIASLERALSGAGLPLRETMPLLANLLSVTLPTDYPAASIGAEELRRRTLDWLASWLLGTGEREPVVLVVEDLHWIDASTLQLLGVLIERARTAPVLLMMTARPDFVPPWPDLDRLALRALEPVHTTAMIELLAHGRTLPPELVTEIAKRTDGIPLFVEELTKNVLEEKPGTATAQTAVAIPFTIQDSLTARLDRLGATKQVAQFASVLGRTFSHELLAAVSSLEPTVLERALAQLVDAGLVLPRGQAAAEGDAPSAPATWSFKHALMRDAAYQSMLRSSRREQHARVAEILEQRFADQLEPEVVALHCEEGGLFERAVDHYARAAEVATRRSAHTEAIGHLRRGIALLDRTPAGLDRERREFDFQAALGPALITLHGYGEPEAASAFERARALCGEMDEGPRLARVLYGLSTYYQARADLSASIELGEHCLALAEKLGDGSLRMLGHLRLGLSFYYAGEHARGLEHHERALALYEPERHRPLAFIYGQEPGALAAIYAAVTLWALGHPGRARECCAQALRIADASDHPHTRAFIAGFTAVLYQMLREPDRAEDYAAQAIAIGRERGFALWVGFGGVVSGWARAVRGKNAPAAIVDMQLGLELLAKIGTINGFAYFPSLLAEAQFAIGDRTAALTSLDVGLAFVQNHRLPYWEPELLRLRAVCHQEENPDGALVDLERARQLACLHGARAHELRIATSASALLQRLGRGEETARVLAALVEQLAGEGETPDLYAARAQLASLREAGAGTR